MQWQACCVVDVALPLHPEAQRLRAEQQQQQQQRRQQQQQPQPQQQPQQQQTNTNAAHMAAAHTVAPGHSSAGTGDKPPQLYLVGNRDFIAVDSSVWGLGPLVGVLQYTVKAGTQRLLQLQCRNLPAWENGVGVRPRLWTGRDGRLSSTSIADMEATQPQLWLAKQASTSRAVAVHLRDDQLAAVYDAAWMHPSPPRLLQVDRIIFFFSVSCCQLIASGLLPPHRQQHMHSNNSNSTNNSDSSPPQQLMMLLTL